jgi:hypothetical protein
MIVDVNDGHYVPMGFVVAVTNSASARTIRE